MPGSEHSPLIRLAAVVLYAACAFATLLCALPGRFESVALLFAPISIYAGALSLGTAKLRPQKYKYSDYRIVCILALLHAVAGCTGAVGLWIIDSSLLVLYGFWGMFFGILPGVLARALVRHATIYFIASIAGPLYILTFFACLS